MPGRGQYDRSAAKAARDDEMTRRGQEAEVATVERQPESAGSNPAAAATIEPAGDVQPHYVREGYPYINKPESVVELQAKLDAANALLDRYKDLVRRNGLWLDE